MAYTVLARRYRSNTFDEVVGQDHVAQTLKRAISSGRIAHAFLFCGTRGTGKTSTARILAKCLNCQSSDAPVTAPCGVCDSCRAIARGEDIDVVEIDAASNTGVDNIRDVIIASAYNTPARGRFKIFIIDEVHMLSKQAFNALLKTLEEPPGHVKFILATTEAEKVLPTILSRCQRYDFRNIPSREVAAHLKAICATENIRADDDALLLVAKAGAGSMRDSLSLLDRLLSVGESTLSVGLIEQLLGLPKAQLVFDLAAAIGTGDVKSALGRADAILANGMSLDTLVAALIDHLRNLMLIRACGSDSELVEVPGLSMADLSAQAGQFDAAALSQDIVILEELRRHARQSQAGRALLDATLVRMSLADQFSSLADLLARSGGGGGPAAPQKKKPDLLPVAPPPAAVAPPPPAAAPPKSAAPAVSAPPSLDDEDDEDDDDLPAPGKVWDGGPRESLATLMARQAATMTAPPEPSNVEPVRSDDFTGQWQAMLGLLADYGPLLGLLQDGRIVDVQDGQAVISYPPEHAFRLKLLEGNGKKDRVRDALSQVFAKPVGVRFQLDTAAAPPPAPRAAPPPPGPRPPVAVPAASPPPAPAEASTAVRLTDELRTSLYQSEPLVRAIVDRMGGTVIKFEE